MKLQQEKMKQIYVGDGRCNPAQGSDKSAGLPIWTA